MVAVGVFWYMNIDTCNNSETHEKQDFGMQNIGNIESLLKNVG